MRPTLEQLLSRFELSDDGATLRILDQDGHQRFSINRSVAISNSDYPLDVPYPHGLYIDGRTNIQTAISRLTAEEANQDDLSPTGSAPRAATLSVQATNIPDRVVVNGWGGDRVPDDGKDAIVYFGSSADQHRPHSKNVIMRTDAINWNPDGGGVVDAVDVREVGANMVPARYPPPEYQGDDWSQMWVLATVARFMAANAIAWAVFFGRCVWNMGVNGDNVDPGNSAVYYETYVMKHLAEARGD